MIHFILNIVSLSHGRGAHVAWLRCTCDTCAYVFNEISYLIISKGNCKECGQHNIIQACSKQHTETHAVYFTSSVTSVDQEELNASRLALKSRPSKIKTGSILAI